MEQLVEKIIEKADLIANQRMAIIYYNNVGDFYSLCASVKSTEEKLNKELVIVYCTDRQLEIAKWFSYDGWNIKLCRISRENYRTLFSANDEIRNKYKEYIVWWKEKNAITELTQNVYEEFGENLRLPKFPVFVGEKYVSQYRIVPQKTILIVPTANAVKSFPDWFWNFCAEVFRTLGFQVVFNANEEESKRFNGVSIAVPLAEAVPFADLCGWVFGVRCGFMDLLSTTKANMTIFSTTFYRPLDKVFRISNEDNRIRTYFYEENDLFFEKTNPVSIVKDEYEKYYSGIRKMLKNTLNVFDVGEECYVKVKVGDIAAYRYSSFVNRNIHSHTYEISPFVPINYSFVFQNGMLKLKLFDLDMTKYRIDCEVFLNTEEVSKINDCPASIIVYEPTISGIYRMRVSVTDLHTLAQEVMLTDEINVHLPIPSQKEDLINCLDLKSYVTALHSFASKLIIFISTCNTHISLEKNNAIEKELDYFRLFGIRTELAQTYRHSFLCIVDAGRLETEICDYNKELSNWFYFGKHKAQIISQGFNSMNGKMCSAKIIIDDKDYAVNSSGLNIVVWDIEHEKVIDSVCFDISSEGKTVRK